MSPDRRLASRRAFSTLALLASSAWTLGSASATEQCLQMQYVAASQNAGSGANDIAAADLDQDGNLDVVVADTAGNQLRILMNQGTHGFMERLVSPGPAPEAVALADMDQDGDIDILVALGGQPNAGSTGYVNDGIRVLRNDGTGTFAPSPLVDFLGADGSPVAVFAVDVNGDGHLDAVVGLFHHALGASYSGGLAVALGDGAGGFAFLPTHTLPVPARNVRLSDFDGDGRVDAAEIGGYSTVTASVFVAFGGGDGTFVNAATGMSGGSYASALAVGDWDGDGDVDLATGGKYAVATLWNDGTGSFTPAFSANFGYYVKGLASGDLDGDGDLDLAATSGSSSVIRLLNNDGSGTFAVAASVPSTTQAYALTLADTNGDGYPDPWAVDVVTGVLTRGTSHCVVARYGQGKVNSLGCTPTMTAVGAPSIAGTGFLARATLELSQQPALVLAGFSPQQVPALGASLLVQAPWILVPAQTGLGSGNPAACDGSVDLPVPAPVLAQLGAGTRVYLQVAAADPFHPDGTGASLSDALMFEVVP